MFLSFLAYKSTPLLFSITKPRRARVALQIMPRFSTYLYSWQYLVFYIKIIGSPQGKRVQVANEKSDDPHQLPLHPKVSQDQLFSLCTLLKFPNNARIWAGLREHILQSRDSGTTFLRARSVRLTRKCAFAHTFKRSARIILRMRIVSSQSFSADVFYISQ